MDGASNLMFGFVEELPDLTAFWAAVAGALAGAIVSSYFAYRIQNRSFKEDRRTRAEELRKTQQVLGRSLILKVARIHSNISTIHGHLEEEFQRARQIEKAMEPWGFVRELAPLPSQVRFTYDELSMLMGLGNDDVFNTVLNMEPVHESTIELVKTFHYHRMKLLERLPISNVRDTVASTDLDPAQMEPLKLQMNAVNSLIEQLRAFSERGRDESRSVLRNLCNLLRNELEIQQGIVFPD